MKKIAIVGAGASGMMAAILLKQRGFDITVFERNEKVMKKIYATGNGRCNFTNRNVGPKNYHGENPKFAISTIKKYGYDEIIDFFNLIGIKEIILEDGKTYPMSLQASSIVKQMELTAENEKVNILTNTYVKDIEKINEKYKVTIINSENNLESREFDYIIISTGGRAMEKSGSDGNGYRLMQKLGHSITKTHPGIVQLKLKDGGFKDMSGVKFPGACYLIDKNKKIMEEKSDILFTDYGISGPGILQISGECMRRLNKGKEVEISIDILPEIEENQLGDFLTYNFMINQYKTLKEGLIGIIHDKLIENLCKYVKINSNINLSEISKEEIHRLTMAIKDWRFKVIGCKSEKDGQVTCGGVSTKEINPKTMESKLYKGVYIIGELVDIDGDCGGYNLHWAWSSAMACADSIN